MVDLEGLLWPTVVDRAAPCDLHENRGERQETAERIAHRGASLPRGGSWSGSGAGLEAHECIPVFTYFLLSSRRFLHA